MCSYNGELMLLPFSLCGESVSLKPSREEWLLSTWANICPVLNWANMDKVNTIAFSVPGCLPCCPFIPFLSLHCRCRADCWLIIAHTAHMLFSSKSLGEGINLIIPFWCVSFYISVCLLGTPVQSKPTGLQQNPTSTKLTMFPCGWRKFVNVHD